MENSTRIFRNSNIYDSNTDLISDKKSNRPSITGFRESKIFVHEIVDQKAYLDMRTMELEQIKKVATQIKDLTVGMKSELEEQGRNVEKIDRNVSEVKLNVIKAELEIEEANKISKSDSKRYGCLIIIILILLTFIGLMCFFILK